MPWTTGFLLVITFTTISQANPIGEEQCLSSFGVNFAEDESWTECVSGCCQAGCTCRRIDGLLTSICYQACPLFFPPEGCVVEEPFQNATHQDCCRLNCQEEKCESSFGVKFAENEQWTECVPDCCQAGCECVRMGQFLTKLCHTACPGNYLTDGCFLEEPFQNATHQDCCRVNCPGIAPDHLPVS